MPNFEVPCFYGPCDGQMAIQVVAGTEWIPPAVQVIQRDKPPRLYGDVIRSGRLKRYTYVRHRWYMLMGDCLWVYQGYFPWLQFPPGFRAPHLSSMYVTREYRPDIMQGIRHYKDS